jgi:peptide/nickel transport system substrate-binding protein
MYSRLTTVILMILIVACAPTTPSSAPTTGQRADGSAPPQATVQRTLVIIGGRAPDTLSAKQLRDSGGAGNPRATYRAFNAGLVLNDERNVPQPYLAESLPELNTDSWRVLPDGRMETIYRLKPNLTWHDGTALTADDFVFAHRVYGAPEYGTASLPPLRYMENVAAPDPRTVVITWRQPYAEASALWTEDFQPLPRHLLEAAFAQGQPDSFVALSFWLTDYVGLGPYRLTRYELGSFAEGTAFAGHALGRPKIDQLRMVYIPDANAALANLMSDSAHLATDSSIDLQQASVLEREWGSRRSGTVLKNPVGVRHVNVQVRPEFASPRGLLDVRVRRALAHMTDRQGLAEGITEGMAPAADTLVLPQVEYFADLERAVVKYPLDPRRAEQLLNEAGYFKASDGIFASQTDGRFVLEAMVAAGARNETEVAIVSDGLRRLGIDAGIKVVPRAQVTEPFVFAHFPGLLTGSHNAAIIPPVQRLRQSELATPENRGRGSNYSGWVHPEAERLIAAYETTLNRSERNQHIVQLLKLVSEEVPIIPLYYNLEFVAKATDLRGPEVGVSQDGVTWNVHTWTWAQ